jgi:undecaprenyl-diphosphatase
MNSFPSGHTQTAFGTAVALICINRKHVIYLLLIASLIGLSRIYVGVHFPLDVICGAIVGALSSLFVFRLCSKYFPKQKPLINNKAGL